jgi:cytochrome b involved in lipid metabolism
MIKNIVTFSLMIFIVVVVGILGAGVYLNKNSANTLSNNQQGNNNINPVPDNSTPAPAVNNYKGDEDNNPNDEEGERGVTTNNVTPPPSNTVPSSTTPTNSITAAQVALHNSYNDCWIIVSGKVYNLTNLIPIHSGGPGQIIPYCGKDGTSAFDTKNGNGSHSQRAQSILNNYYVGNLR